MLAQQRRRGQAVEEGKVSLAVVGKKEVRHPLGQRHMLRPPIVSQPDRLAHGVRSICHAVNIEWLHDRAAIRAASPSFTGMVPRSKMSPAPPSMSPSVRAAAGRSPSSMTSAGLAGC